MATYDGVASANIKMNNSNDELRAYDISAEFVVDSDNKVVNVMNGRVSKDSVTLATFFKSTLRKDVSWRSTVETEEEQNAINSAVTSFIADGIVSITDTNPLNI